MIVPTEDAKQALESHIQDCLESKVNLFYISDYHRFRKNCKGSYRLETRGSRKDDIWYEDSLACVIDLVEDFQFNEVSVFNIDLLSKE
jgi:hypothetical protein